MATFDVLVDAFRKGDVVRLVLRRGDRRTTRDLLWSEVDSEAKFADWLVSQTFPAGATEPTLRRALAVEAHQEQVIDPETGLPVDVWVVDSVSSALLPEADARTGIEALPGWASWTAQEADDWIVANVTDLASAVTVLRAMARMIVHLRDHALERVTW